MSDGGFCHYCQKAVCECHQIENESGKMALLTPLEQKLISLFEEYRECFGLEDKDSSEQAIEFEDKFAAAVCAMRGHYLEPDQCMIPGHDFCVMCGTNRDHALPGSIGNDFRLRT